MNILVTGASRGIGAAAFALLRSTGHNVAGHSTRGSDELIAADLADPDAPRALWDAALDRLGGRIDVLVNNAGIYESVADDAADAQWHAAWARMLAINLQAPADLSRTAIGHFREQSGGRIVNVASRAAYRGDSPQHWHYAASKAALIGMTKTIARGYAAEQILAFAVAPGFTVSEMTDEYLAGQMLRIHSTSFQLNVSSNWWPIHLVSALTLALPGTRPTRLPKPSAGWRSTRLHRRPER